MSNEISLKRTYLECSQSHQAKDKRVRELETQLERMQARMARLKRRLIKARWERRVTKKKMKVAKDACDLQSETIDLVASEDVEKFDVNAVLSNADVEADTGVKCEDDTKGSFFIDLCGDDADDADARTKVDGGDDEKAVDAADMKDEEKVVVNSSLAGSVVGPAGAKCEDDSPSYSFVDLCDDDEDDGSEKVKVDINEKAVDDGEEKDKADAVPSGLGARATFPAWDHNWNRKVAMEIHDVEMEGDDDDDYPDSDGDDEEYEEVHQKAELILAADMAGQLLKRSVGRTRKELNKIPNIGKYMKDCQFGQGVVSHKGGRVYAITLNDQWNVLAKRVDEDQEWYVGTGALRRRNAKLVAKSTIPIPFFQSPKIGERTCKIYYVGHYSLIHMRELEDDPEIMRKKRQLVLVFSFTHFDACFARIIAE
jgi:hypothetical protein